MQFSSCKSAESSMLCQQVPKADYVFANQDETYPRFTISVFYLWSNFKNQSGVSWDLDDAGENLFTVHLKCST